MPKWLYTFAVVRKGFGETELLADRARAAEGADDSAAFGPGRFEQALMRLMQSVHADDVAYCRVVMDGWNRTHYWLARWILETYPDVKEEWEAFTDSHVIVVEPAESPLMQMLPTPNRRVLARAVKGLGPGEYAGYAFLYALYDGLVFARTTLCPLVVLARCLGPSMDDSEYT